MKPIFVKIESYPNSYTVDDLRTTLLHELGMVDVTEFQHHEIKDYTAKRGEVSENVRSKIQEISDNLQAMCVICSLSPKFGARPVCLMKCKSGRFIIKLQEALDEC